MTLPLQALPSELSNAVEPSAIADHCADSVCEREFEAQVGHEGARHGVP